MPKVLAPATFPLCTCRAFEPARYSQHHLAAAYLQLVPTPRRLLPATAGGAAGRPGRMARPAAS